ncbi:hypothetical protein [Cystobacter fuscus]|uniref:hypothetical protein n=1 Tax=Cystobacter fuscus TaxID=43 RepID=UPI0037C1745E
MRKNLPVTATEYLRRTANPWWPRRTPKAASPTSIRTSSKRAAFSEAELLGKAHTIVRHPEMPSEAFEELMGHATIEMTERYAHLPETRASAMHQLTFLCPTSKPLRPEAPKGHTEGICENEGKEKAQ